MTAPLARLRALYTAHGAFPVHVVRENGLPDVALTVFANDLRRILSDNSVRGYVRETLAFVNWCGTDPVTRARQWHWQPEPPQVRHAVRHYLTVAAECRIIVRPDTLGLKASYINATAGTGISVGLLLVALKKRTTCWSIAVCIPMPTRWSTRPRVRRWVRSVACDVTWMQARGQQRRYRPLLAGVSSRV